MRCVKFRLVHMTLLMKQLRRLSPVLFFKFWGFIYGKSDLQNVVKIVDYSKLSYLYLCNFGSLMTRFSFNHSHVFDPIWSQLQEFIWCVCLLCRINFYLTFAAQLPYYVTAFKAFKEPSEMSSKGLVSVDKILTWDIINLVKLKI